MAKEPQEMTLDQFFAGMESAEVVIASGAEVDWSVCEAFAGRFEKVEVIDLDDPEHAGEKRPSNLYTFAQIFAGDSSGKSGDPRTIWGNYQIDKGMQGVTPGDTVYFQYLGKKDGKGGKRPVNLFNIRVQRAN